MATKNYKLTIIIPNYTIAAYLARFECEHPGVRSMITNTMIFPDVLTYQAFMFELSKMGNINSQPCRVIELR